MRNKPTERSFSTDKRSPNTFTRIDIAAIVCFAALTCYFVFAIQRGISVIDESFYLTIPHRLLFGDSLLTDEWHLSQLSSFFQILPLRLFITFTGSTEGIVLFMRYVFLVCWLAVSAVVYITLRRYGIAALAGSVFFAFTVPMDIPSVNYYSALVMSAVLLCCILFWKEKKELSAAQLVFSGILLSCMVLNDPLDAVLYFVFSAAVLIALIRKRVCKKSTGKFGYLLELRSWIFLSVGILVSMAAVFGFILSRTDLSSVIRSLPELLTDSEYSFASSEGSLLTASSHNVLSLHLLASCVKALGTVRSLIFIALCAAGLILRKRGNKVIAVPLLCACGCIILMSVSFYRYDMRWEFRIPCINIPTAFCGAMLLSYLAKHDTRLTFSAFFLFAVTVIRDVSSEITLGIAACTCIPVFAVCFSELIKGLAAVPTDDTENSREKPFPAKMLRTVCISAVSAAVLVTLSVSALTSARLPYVFETTFYYLSGDTSRETLDRGPLKGIRTYGKLANTYGLIMDDLDEIKEKCGGAVYVANLNSWYYLHLEKPYGTYSTWYVEEDSETRQLHYWDLHPDKRPEYIYIPKIDRNTFSADNAAAASKLAFVQSLCECETKESLAGITVRVLSWK